MVFMIPQILVQDRLQPVASILVIGDRNQVVWKAKVSGLAFSKTIQTIVMMPPVLIYLETKTKVRDQKRKVSFQGDSWMMTTTNANQMTQMLTTSRVQRLLLRMIFTLADQVILKGNHLCQLRLLWNPLEGQIFLRQWRKGATP
jgi:hypothetical protein